MPSLYQTTPETGTVSSTNLTSLYSNTSSFTTGLVNSSVFSVSGGLGVTVNPTTGNVVVSIGQDVATTANVSFVNVTATGNLSNNYFTLANSAGSNGQVLTTNGAGVTSWTTPSGLGLVTSITGTANQIIASSPTGAVTLSTPQDIATTSNPTFAGATLGSITVGITTNNTITTTSGDLTLTAAGGDVNVTGNLNSTGAVSGDYFVAGGVMAYDASGPFTTSTTTPNQVASSTNATAYRSLKYIYQITSGTEYQVVEIMIIHDGTTAYLNTYGDVRTGANLSTFDADISGGNIRLLVTPTNAVTTYQGSVIAVEV